MELESNTNPSIPEVSLRDLPDLCGQLAGMVKSAGFTPDLVVYVERGARLVAAEFCQILGCEAIGVTTRRNAFALRRFIAPVIMHMPQSTRNMLRKMDEKWMWQKPGGDPRTVESPFTGSLSGRRILLVDDAIDSGGSILGCHIWLNSRGVNRSDTKVAVLAATTPAGREYADFWIFERNTRLPWSSDSPERKEAEFLWQQNRPPVYAPGDI